MPRLLSAVQSYRLAVLAVSVALAGALLLERYNFRGVEFPVFLFAIVLTVWYARLLSVYTGAIQTQQALAAGVSELLTKPILSHEMATSPAAAASLQTCGRQ